MRTLEDSASWLLHSFSRFLRSKSTSRREVNHGCPMSNGTAWSLSDTPANGKSAWAANVASLSSEIVTYVPCSPSTDQDVAARVVQAVVATLAARGEIRAHELVLPGRVGVDALSLLDRTLNARGIALTVMLDDCHRASADALVETMRAGPTIRWCLVGRPSSAITEASALTGLESHTLSGWDADSIARKLSDADASTAPEAVAHLRRLTGGAPLFVLRSVADIKQSGGDTAAYCSQLAAGDTASESAQEQILGRTVSSLQPDEIRVAAALAGVELGFSVREWGELLSEPLDIPSAGVRRSLRKLVDRQIATETVQDHVAVHDAFRPLLRDRDLSKSESKAVLLRAVHLLRTQLSEGRVLEAIVPLIRVLAALGEMSQLADLANSMSDWIRETGARSEVEGYVELAVISDSLSAEDRFWTLDTLAFFDIESGRVDVAAERLSEMERLATEVGPETRGPILHKRLLIAAKRGDIATVRSIVGAASAHPRYERVLRYHGALAEAEHGNIDDALGELSELASDHMTALGLSPQQVLGANPPEIWALMKADADVGDVRRLADCCDAIAKLGRGYPRHRNRVGINSIWAMKFYGMVGAHRSCLLAGQEMLDMFLRDLEDPEEARRWMEEVMLPAAQEPKLVDLSVPIRAQYAVLLGHCGDFAAAEEVFAKLEPYVSSLRREGREEIENQKRLLAALVKKGPPAPQEIAARHARIAAQHDLANQLRRRLSGTPLPTGDAPARSNKFGRNQPCPCGSGKKYKKCCGGPRR